MNESDVRQAAVGLDPERALELERAATYFARDAGEAALEPCIAVARDRDAAEADRLFAATTAVVLSRRLHRREDAEDAVRAVARDFHRVPLVWHLRSLVAMLDGSDASVREAVETAEDAYEKLGEHPGVVHTLAWALVESAERDAAPADDPRYDRALEIVCQAIRLLRDVPDEDRFMYRGRFFHTRARIRRRRGETAGARADLQLAIAAEDRDAPDYFLRIADYVIEQSLLNADRTFGELRAAVDTGAKRLEAAELGTVGAVGFVAATIGLIQVAVSQVGGRPFWQAIVLVAGFGVILFGAVGAGIAGMRRARAPRR